ncbi:MAG: HesB/IscA family protein [Vampirovibrionales bacterium]
MSDASISPSAITLTIEAAKASLSQVVTLTDAARAKMLETAKAENALGIRLSVIGGGCAGLQYDMTPCKEPVAGDFTQQEGDLTVYVHPVATAYLKGTTIDFSHALMDGGFKFHNPNAASACGCGSSFGM